MDLKEFIKWYEDAYSQGDMNSDALRQGAAYLDGFGDASGGNEQMQRVATMLRGAANLAEWMQRKAGA